MPYVTNRAIQNRLDDVMGPDRWHNEFKPWHSTGKRESQLCGISLYFEERGWITKWDGAEDSDIEPIKGGLSDSMKRAANQWGHRPCSLQYGHRLGQCGEEGQELHHQAHRARQAGRPVSGDAEKSRSDTGESLRHPVLLIPALRTEEQAPAPTAKPTAKKSRPSHRRTRPLFRFLPASTPYWRPRLQGRPCSLF